MIGRSIFVGVAAALGLIGASAHGAPMGTAFTYQGSLVKGGVPVTNVCSFEFRLFDAASAGNQLGPTLASDTGVIDGHFSQLLDFGNVFPGEARWLQLGVQCPGDASQVTLTPRVELTPVPYALYAANSGGAGGWSLTGNAGTTPGTNFLGTTDNQPVELRVNNLRAIRWESSATSPNIIGGHDQNQVTAGAAGATIAGGGEDTLPNRVTDSFGTIGGGSYNQAGDDAGTTSDNTYGTVGGGRFNTASGQNSTIGGGENNTASDPYSAVTGGYINMASGAASTIPGGALNIAAGDFSFAAGVGALANHNGTFVWADSSDLFSSFTSTGNFQFLIRATGGVGIQTNNPTSPLTVAGMIESNADGYKFPDGTVQTSAASGTGTSHWTKVGDDIFYNDGSVGIATATSTPFASSLSTIVGRCQKGWLRVVQRTKQPGKCIVLGASKAFPI